jgi:hypothetical protein
MSPQQHLGRVRGWLAVFIVGLVLSGVTAFPLVTEVTVLHRLLHLAWIDRVYTGLVETADRYPFLAYGTDWLAFAHLTIAVAFWGPMREPVRNIWVVQFGMIACAGIIPFALIAGPVRHIPFWWTCIDMSFGVYGIVPLLLAYRHIRKLAGHEGSRAIKAGVAATA